MNSSLRLQKKEVLPVRETCFNLFLLNIRKMLTDKALTKFCYVDLEVNGHKRCKYCPASAKPVRGYNGYFNFRRHMVNKHLHIIATIPVEDPETTARMNARDRKSRKRERDQTSWWDEDMPLKRIISNARRVGLAKADHTVDHLQCNTCNKWHEVPNKWWRMYMVKMYHKDEWECEDMAWNQDVTCGQHAAQDTARREAAQAKAAQKSREIERILFND